MAATPATSLTLVTSGLQDSRLIPSLGNPDINQFCKVLRKTTRYASQWNRVEFDGNPCFGQRVSMTLPILGELITGFSLVVTMPDIYTIQSKVQAYATTNNRTFLGPSYGWTNGLGHALIELIELEIGGIIVDRYDSNLLEILDELYETIESSVTKNALIGRTANGFNSTSLQGTSTSPVTVRVPIPFWWSRPGQYNMALPIQALKEDKVRIHVTFRPINQLFYTEARVDSRTVGFRPGIDIVGGMWDIQGTRWWWANPTSTSRVYSMNTSMPETGVSGEIIPGFTGATVLQLQDAYALVEYISLEEAESIAMRTAELTYRIPQHFLVPTVNTNGTQLIRINLPYSNPVKEILWVAQRPEIVNYNAWFLYTRDLQSSSIVNPTLIPWWPNAMPIPSQTTNWQSIPAFQWSFSEPIKGATLMYNNIERIVQDTGSTFRSLIPALKYVKSALYDRYIYAYSFTQKVEPNLYEVQGFANWDKIPRKELYLTLNNCPNLNIYIYITTYNIFKVYGGRGVMLFTN
jgi:hypothetical protein